jgi:ABC-2 type transport system permease protein
MTTFARAWLGEYRKIIGDAGAVLILVGAVLLYALIYPFPYRQEVLFDVPVAVVDLDRTPLSRQLTRAIDATQTGAVTARPADLAAARRLFARGRVKGICLIPKDFARRLQRGEAATVTGYCDGSYIYLYKAVVRSLGAATGDLSARLELRSLTAGGRSAPAAQKLRDPLPLERIYLFNPAGGYASYLVPAIFVMILQQTLLMGIGLLDGTENEAAATRPPVRRPPWPAVAARVLGRAGAYVSGHLVLGLFLLGGMIRWYRYPQRGALGDVLLFILPLLLAAVFLAITLARWFSTRESALPVMLSVSVPLVFLSGFSWPSQAMPFWLQLLAQFVPSTSAIQGFYAINHMGATLSEVIGLWGRLWALAGIYFVTACLVTRRRAHG